MAADSSELSALRQHISSLPTNSVVRRKVSAVIDEMTAAPPDTEFVRMIRDAQLPTQPRGLGDLLALAVHCLLVKKHGFVATGKEPVPGSSAVPGFAPPLRVQDISETKLAPTSWQNGGGTNDDGNCVFTYRDGARRPYSMRAIRVTSTLVVHFGAAPTSASSSQAIDASDVSSIELDIEKYLVSQQAADTDSVAAASSQWLDPGALDAAVTAALFPSGSLASTSASTASATSKHAAPTMPSSSTTAAAANPSASRPASRPLPRSSAPPRPMPAAAPPRFQPPVHAPNIGPFAPSRGFRPGDFDGDLLPGGVGGGGNLMGPGFLGPGMPADFGGIPRPRFDPYGPPQPNNDHLRVPRPDDDNPPPSGMYF